MGQVEEKKEPMVEDANDNNSNLDNPVTSIKTEVCVYIYMYVLYVCVYVWGGGVGVCEGYKILSIDFSKLLNLQT